MNSLTSTSKSLGYANYWKPLGLALSLCSALLLAACGGTGTGAKTSSISTDNGTLQLAITDAAEDFLSYQIGLDSINLNRVDGTTVNILPLKSQIDFVQYQELSELFAVLTVPKGVYSSITLSLDYTDADIVIQDDLGASHHASAVDTAGNPLTTLNVELKLNNNEPIRISPTKAAQLTLDLDLAASNTIESFNPAIVTVEPFMIGSTSFTAGREHRIRGLLQSSNLAAQTISLNIRPMRFKKGKFGEFTFAVNSTTHYEINGVELNGSEGLAALSKLSTNTPLVAFGEANKQDGQRYQAKQVIAGTSVPWSNSDVVKGIITKRVGNTLTVKGAVLESQDKKASFHQTIDITLNDNSIVTGYRLGDSTITNLSIGQRILALGQFNPESGIFNAKNGSVRMKINKIVGEVAQVSPLQLKLSHINKRPVEVFDFAGTGVSTNDDAKPNSYKINTGSLDLGAVNINEWMQVQGYPTAFGSAPMDFDALTVVNPNFAAHLAKLHARWGKTDTGNISITNDVLVMNNATGKSKLQLLGVPRSSKLGLTVETVSGNGATGVYGILTRGKTIQLYRDFAEFITAVQSQINHGLDVINLTAAGHYSDTLHTLEAGYITLIFNTPALK